MEKSRLSSLGYRTKLTILDILRPIKWQLIITGFVVLVGFIVGFYYSFTLASADCVNEDMLLCFLTGQMSNFTTMFYRILSSLFVLLLLWLFSKSKWLSPLALVIIFYRAYLLGINLGIMLRFYGVSGVIVAILLIFPIQVALLAFFGIFYWTMLRSCNSMVLFPAKKFILISLLIIVAINFAFAILLMLFSPNVILVL